MRRVVSCGLGSLLGPGTFNHLEHGICSCCDGEGGGHGKKGGIKVVGINGRWATWFLLVGDLRIPLPLRNKRMSLQGADRARLAPGWVGRVAVRLVIPQMNDWKQKQQWPKGSGWEAGSYPSAEMMVVVDEGDTEIGGQA